MCSVSWAGRRGRSDHCPGQIRVNIPNFEYPPCSWTHGHWFHWGKLLYPVQDALRPTLQCHQRTGSIQSYISLSAPLCYSCWPQQDGSSAIWMVFFESCCESSCSLLKKSEKPSGGDCLDLDDPTMRPVVLAYMIPISLIKQELLYYRNAFLNYLLLIILFSVAFYKSNKGLDIYNWFGAIYGIYMKVSICRCY